MSTRCKYEQTINTNPNYNFIPDNLKQSWVSVSKAGVNPRKIYWETELDNKITNGEIPKNATLTNLARYIHPTGKHTCKICNEEASIYYVYPTKNTNKWLLKKFEYELIDNSKTIFDIYDDLNDINKEKQFCSYFKIINIEAFKNECFSDKYYGKKLSPGVMGNPPDRLDGFHCYNSICTCRKSKDKGRSDENMKSYTRDRRCFEMYSDGNLLLANLLMGKLNTIKTTCFICNKEATMTADHIGPISLGFIHDPTNFQACCSSCNSCKNNRFTQSDISKLTLLEQKGYQIVSWWAKDCWDTNKGKSPTIIKKKMDKNAKKFLNILEWLKKNKQNIVEQYIETNYDFNDSVSFQYTITTIEIALNGNITFQYTKKNSTKKTKEKQKKRSKEICLESTNKENRKIKEKITIKNLTLLSKITNDTFKNTICKILQG